MGQRRRKKNKATRAELDLGCEEKIEDVFVTEEERRTRDDVTKEMKIEQLNECQVSGKVPEGEWMVDGYMKNRVSMADHGRSLD